MAASGIFTDRPRSRFHIDIYSCSKIGQGRENAKNFLLANQELCAEIETKVRQKYGLADGPAGDTAEKKDKGLAPVEKKADAEPAQKNPAK